MAILQSTDRLEQMIGNKYSLVIVAAKRARQLKEGHPALAEDPTTASFLSISLREIEDDLVHPVAPPEEELAPAPRDVISSLVAGADFDLEDEDMDDGDAVDDLAALLVGADDDDDDSDSDTDVLTPVASPVSVDTDDDTDADDGVDTDDDTDDPDVEDVEDTDDDEDETDE
jgi:DNA-directed RNA polymerase subunit omega